MKYTKVGTDDRLRLQIDGLLPYNVRHLMVSEST